VGILSWIIVGLVAGALAKLIMPGRDPGGIIVTMLIGIVGAIIGGFVVGLFVGGDLISGINITTIIVATLGAILLLAIYRWFVGRRVARV
jgi:uncharacterized membrane protein YeaQ/YmgE (transglycosylase-associated protein family)